MSVENAKTTVNYEECTVLLLDVAGTTTSKSFVKETLFPYAVGHVEEYLKENWDQDEVKTVIKSLKGDEELTVDAASKVFKELTESGDEGEPVKALQGLLYQKGYDDGKLKAHVFSDVSPLLESWSKTKKVSIYSTGSVKAQKLLFAHTTDGDLTQYIQHYFDQSAGSKTETESYVKIAKELSVEPQQILYINDNADELKAAKSAGLQTVLISRDEPKDDQDFVVISSFSEINVDAAKKRKIEEVAESEAPPSKVAKTGENGDNTESVIENEDKKNEDEAMEVDETPEVSKPTEDLPDKVETKQTELPEKTETELEKPDETKTETAAEKQGETKEIPQEKLEETKSITEETKSITEDTKTITEDTKTITEVTKTITEDTKTITEDTKSITEDTKSVTEETKSSAEETVTEEVNTTIEKTVTVDETKVEGADSVMDIEETKIHTKETIEKSTIVDDAKVNVEETTIDTEETKMHMEEVQSDGADLVADYGKKEVHVVESGADGTASKIDIEQTTVHLEQTSADGTITTQIDIEETAFDVKEIKSADSVPEVAAGKTENDSTEKCKQTEESGEVEKETVKSDEVPSEKVNDEEKDSGKVDNGQETPAESKTNEGESKANESESKANESESKANEGESKANESESRASEGEVEKTNGAEATVTSEEKENQSELANGSAETESETKTQNGDVETNEEEIKVKKIDETAAESSTPVSVEV